METRANRIASLRNRSNRIEKTELEKDPENGIVSLDRLPSFPENPEDENTFREQLIATEEEGVEPAPLAKDLENGYWNEATGTGLDPVSKRGDQMDDYYETLGEQLGKNEFTLGPNNYDSIPTPQKQG